MVVGDPGSEIVCWLWPLAGQGNVDHLERLLSPNERSIAARFRAAANRVSYVAAHVYLRVILSRFVGVRPSQIVFHASSFGKPYVAKSAWKFNLSHTRSHAICAVGRGELGVDLESTSTALDVEGLASQVLSKAEQIELEQLAPGERTEAFYRVWVRKEALLKAWGVGLALEPSHAHVGVGPWPCCAWQKLAPSAEGKWWLGQDIAAPSGHLASIAIESELAPSLTTISLDEDQLAEALCFALERAN